MSEESQQNSRDLPKKLLDEIEEIARSKKLNKEEKQKLEEMVRIQYTKSRFEPGETVGILAAQSISEPATQMSLHPSERILIKKDGIVFPEKIGDFVDSLINKFGFREEGQNQILDLNDSENYCVYSLDKDEKLRLKKIKSVIRHKAPKKLLKITTSSGRRIIATDHHSFVIRKNNKIIPVSGTALRKGERIPVMKFLPEHSIEKINLESMIQSRELFLEGGKVFPYPAHSKGMPNNLRLDRGLGWLMGAYLAEGNSTRNFVNISNTGKRFNEQIRNFARNFGFTVNEYDNFRGFSKGHDIRVNSTLLSLFLKESCGSDSRSKHIPIFAFSANENFVRSLLQAYFDGDGSITVDRKGIRASSESLELIKGIAILLNRFNIFCSISDDGRSIWIPYKYAETFLRRIGTVVDDRRRKLKKLYSTWRKAHTRTEQTDMIPGIGTLLFDLSKKTGLPTRYVNNFTKRQRIGRSTLEKYVELFERISQNKGVDISKEIKILKTALNSDVVWDETEKIEYVDSDADFVYDISVDGLETFATFDGILTHNTMRTYHFAGSAGIKVTYGLPRLIEIFDAKKEPETPVMTIFLKREFNNRETAKDIAEEIVEKNIADITKRVSLNLSENSIEIEPDDLKRISTVLKVIKENTKNVNVKARTRSVVISPKTEVDIKELQKMKVKILELKVSGVTGILNAVVRRENEDWIINTIGSNLEQVFQIKEVDEDKTITNDIHEVMRLLGIEAARNLIINEALKTMQEQGLDVDVRHVMLVGDIMTFDGGVKSIGRYGVAGTQTSVLARAAFEETIKHLVRASIRNETDNFQGIFENVMIGQVIPSGTGMFDLVAKFEEEEGK